MLTPWYGCDWFDEVGHVRTEGWGIEEFRG